ncbi:DUF3224 domain-containing protein [Dyadobacter jejuensis]|nr:DUF3224 domain-containing protein [Dyadobacter jejuensis]
MTLKAEVAYQITDGYEESFSKNELGHKLTTGKFTIAYSGDVEGEGHLMELKNHGNEDEATVYGLERFVGSVHGISGSFVLEYTGKYENGLLHSTRRIVKNSGTGELQNIEGYIAFSHANAKEMKFTLRFKLPQYKDQIPDGIEPR